MRPTSLYLDDIKWERLYHRQITIARRKRCFLTMISAVNILSPTSMSMQSRSWEVSLQSFGDEEYLIEYLL